MNSLYLLGAGGHCASCIEVVESGSDWHVRGIIDMQERRSGSFLGYPVVGSDADLPALLEQCRNALVAVGFVRHPENRMRLFQRLVDLGATSPVIVASSAHVSVRADLGPGTVVMHGAMVNTGVQAGVNCIINTGAIIEHGVSVGDHSHVATGAIINGECMIGAGTFIGSGARIRQGLRIAPGCVVGAGAVVISDLPIKGEYIGVPARMRV